METRQAINVTNSGSSATNTSSAIGGGSDVAFTRNGNSLTIKLRGGAASGTYAGASDYYAPVTDYHVNSQAQISQYKLKMTQTKTTSTPATGSLTDIQAHLGVSNFDSTQFTVTSGWVSLQTSTSITTGIPVDRLQRAPANAEATGLKGGIIGTTSTAASNFSYLSSATVVNYLEALTKDGRQTLTGNLLPATQNNIDLGSANFEYNNIYSHAFIGTATQSTKLASSLDFETYVTATTATSLSTIVQRMNDGTINGKFIVDKTASIAPAIDDTASSANGSSVGEATRRFTNIYGAYYVAPANFNSTFTGAWTLSGSISNAIGSTSQLGLPSSRISEINVQNYNGVATTSTRFYGQIDASYIDGQTGMWASTTRPGPTIMYVGNEDRGYMMKGSTSSGYFYLQGYYSDGSTALPGAKGTVMVDYAKKAGDSVNAEQAATLLVDSTNYRSASVTTTLADTVAVRNSSGNLSTNYFISSDDTDPSTVTDAVTYLMGKKGDNKVRGVTKAQLATFISGQTFTAAQVGHNLSLGTHLSWSVGSDFNGSASSTIATDATSGWTSGNGANLVSRDASGNFTAGTITASFSGNLTGTPTVPSITKSGTNASGDIGQTDNRFGNVYGTTFYGVATSAQYADLAEKYMPDAEYEPGTLVVFGGTEEVTVSDVVADNRVCGIISTNPAYMMNSGLEGGVYIALAGRVPCKVIGKIKKGDLLVASGMPGVATSINNVFGPNHKEIGTIVGKAIQSYDNNSDVGLIEVMVRSV
jgi:hypothetical protein